MRYAFLEVVVEDLSSKYDKQMLNRLVKLKVLDKIKGEKGKKVYTLGSKGLDMSTSLTNEELSRNILWLTLAVVVLTIVIVLLEILPKIWIYL